MESSNWPKRLSKQGYTLDSPQRNRIRFQTIEQLVEYEDSFEPSIRHSYRKPTLRSIEVARTFSGGMGKDVRGGED